jgi:hypothetical protein
MATAVAAPPPPRRDAFTLSFGGGAFAVGAGRGIAS